MTYEEIVAPEIRYLKMVRNVGLAVFLVCAFIVYRTYDGMRMSGVGLPIIMVLLIQYLMTRRIKLIFKDFVNEDSARYQKVATYVDHADVSTLAARLDVQGDEIKVQDRQSWIFGIAGQIAIDLFNILNETTRKALLPVAILFLVPVIFHSVAPVDIQNAFSCWFNKQGWTQC